MIKINDDYHLSKDLGNDFVLYHTICNATVSVYYARYIRNYAKSSYCVKCELNAPKEIIDKIGFICG